MTRLTRLREDLRQRRHHRAFRIPPPVLTDEQCRLVEHLLAQARAAAPPPEPAPAAAPEPEPEPEPTTEPAPDEAALATAATNLWRAERKLTPTGERPTARDRQAARYLRTCGDALAEAGLVVQDHDGDPFNPGRALEVLVYQENPDLTAETVLETVRPSVYLHGRLIQMGQVIVGTPTPSPDPRSDHA
ncbi:hypothetical protein [Micromonospora sp. URMC 103]|uniref:hypothetical protein n=1 Tax=Micromonospora sp. URMC 103 TaxID=3423406 RepID=UPI003F1B02FD